MAKNETSLFCQRPEHGLRRVCERRGLAQTDNGNLYGIPYDDFLAESIDLESTYIAHLDYIYQIWPIATARASSLAWWPTAPARTANLGQFH